MPLLRANDTPVRASAFSMADVEHHARDVVTRARAEAEKILQEAKKQGEQSAQMMRDKAKAEGYQQGLKQGLEEGKKQGHDAALNEHRAKLNELIATLGAALHEVEAHRVELRDGAEYEVLKFALAVAGRVCRQKLNVDEMDGGRGTAALEAVREALGMISSASSVNVTVNTQNLATLVRELPALKVTFPQLTTIELLGSDEVSPGGCLLSTRSGSIDLTVEKQLRRIVEELVPEGNAASQIMQSVLKQQAVEAAPQAAADEKPTPAAKPGAQAEKVSDNQSVSANAKPQEVKKPSQASAAEQSEVIEIDGLEGSFDTPFMGDDAADDEGHEKGAA